MAKRPIYGRRTAIAVEKEAEVPKPPKEKTSVGKIRKSQLITTYGIGSMVDFKEDTVVIAATDDWDKAWNHPEDRKIFNENLSVMTGAEYFLSPKTTPSSSSFSNTNDIAAYRFPEKLHCSVCGCLWNVQDLNIQKRNVCPNCKKKALNASRFIVVCAKGHMDDFPYEWWVHNGKSCPSGKSAPRMRMRNISGRSDIRSLQLECLECKATRSMQGAFSEYALSDYPCTCKYPHFRDPLVRSKYGCKEKMRTRLRSASGVYFPVTKSALLIPPWSRQVVQYMQKNYELLEKIEEAKRLDTIRKVLKDDSISDEEIQRSWRAVHFSLEKKKKRTETSVLQDEYAVLSNTENEDDERFSSYSATIPEAYRPFFEQVAVVDRLTVTQAFTGFTRITRNESNLVPISQYPKEWLPAVELMGEGIFIRFRKERVQEWQNAHADRYLLMQKAMQDGNFTFQDFSGTYVLLHTFAHLFIREITNVCGYSAASIREKIYSEVEEHGEVKMCGVLIYVSSTDSDSSLGGLISVADDTEALKRILDSMLERADWCSADPLCILSTRQGYKNMNYAACHDCTLLPETSCERFNVFLDRASIVGLPDDSGLGYFRSK